MYYHFWTTCSLYFMLSTQNWIVCTEVIFCPVTLFIQKIIRLLPLELCTSEITLYTSRFYYGSVKHNQTQSQVSPKKNHAAAKKGKWLVRQTRRVLPRVYIRQRKKLGSALCGLNSHYVVFASSVFPFITLRCVDEVASCCWKHHPLKSQIWIQQLSKHWC